jgi:hypothetical protein
MQWSQERISVRDLSGCWANLSGSRSSIAAINSLRPAHPQEYHPGVRAGNCLNLSVLSRSMIGNLRPRGEARMKTRRFIMMFMSIAGMLVLAARTTAQNTDKEKLIEIERAFAANPNANAKTAAIVKKYLYDGPINQLTALGRVGTLSKARIVQLASAPDPSDPNARSVTEVSQFHVDIYGTTALVSYKQTSTDTGHKEAALDSSGRYGCLDTFVKRNGSWLYVGGGCAPAEPFSQAVWDAAKKAMAQEPKDLQQAYH